MVGEVLVRPGNVEAGHLGTLGREPQGRGAADGTWARRPGDERDPAGDALQHQSTVIVKTVSGVGDSVALDLKLVHTLALRMGRSEVAKRTVITSWTQLLSYVRLALAHETREQFRVLFLDRKNQLIADEIQNRGTVDHAPVYPREVMRRALELSSSNVILVHNHPSGDPTPSHADVEMTRQVVEAGRALKIGVHDHLVVGRDGVASFKSLGLM